MQSSLTQKIKIISMATTVSHWKMQVLKYLFPNNQKTEFRENRFLKIILINLSIKNIHILPMLEVY